MTVEHRPEDAPRSGAHAGRGRTAVDDFDVNDP
jgi:hypothetical protein